MNETVSDEELKSDSSLGLAQEYLVMIYPLFMSMGLGGTLMYYAHYYANQIYKKIKEKFTS